MFGSGRPAFLKPGSQPPTPGANASVASSRGPATPIPQVFTPQLSRDQQQVEATTSSSKTDTDASTSLPAVARDAIRKREREEAPPLDTGALNKLQAKVMKAELVGAANAESLRAKLHAALAKSQRGGDLEPGFFDLDPKGGGLLPVEGDKEVHVLPTLDGHGRLYDVGHGQNDDVSTRPAQRQKRRKVETHDHQTGQRIRYEDEQDGITLAELVRQERFAGGSADQKNMDAALATQISRDSGFKNTEDYLDERADKLARKAMKTDALKRQFAIQDFARTKKALDACQFCWQDEGSRPPRATVIASGTRAFLALPRGESLVEGHCYIVPMQHYISSLEADDDCWDEIKNFMKCLMQMAAARKQGVVFCETVLNIRAQRHTYIEAIPVPHDLFEQIPGVFKQSILMSEDEWSQNRKLIDFKDKGFRRTMVPQLPYFMVQWDYKGLQGYGKVIEGTDSNRGEKGGEEDALEEMSTAGGEVPHYFAAEIVGTLLDLEPRQWRKPRRLSSEEERTRTTAFKKQWQPFDWTRLLAQTESSGSTSTGKANGPSAPDTSVA